MTSAETGDQAVAACTSRAKTPQAKPKRAEFSGPFALLGSERVTSSVGHQCFSDLLRTLPHSHVACFDFDDFIAVQALRRASLGLR